MVEEFSQAALEESSRDAADGRAWWCSDDAKVYQFIGQDNIYASGKLGAARALSGELSGNYVMIGDTVHDFEAAHELGADCILYSGGHAPYEKLAELGFPIVGDLRDAADIILGD